MTPTAPQDSGNQTSNLHTSENVTPNLRENIGQDSGDGVEAIIDGLIDYAESGRTTLGRPTALTPSEAKAAIELLLLEREKKVEQKYIKQYLEGYIELLETCIPARPEDLTMTQWYGWADTMKKSLMEAKDELQSNLQEKGKA